MQYPHEVGDLYWLGWRFAVPGIGTWNVPRSSVKIFVITLLVNKLCVTVDWVLVWTKAGLDASNVCFNC